MRRMRMSGMLANRSGGVPLTNDSAPPYVLTPLSIPDGVPWITFSEMYAHLLIRSRCSLPQIPAAPWAGFGIALVAASSAADMHTAYAAEEPSPAPMGRS